MVNHPGGTLSFYAKSSFDYNGADEFKIAYSMTGNAPDDFQFLNGGATTSTSTNWVKYEFPIPAGAKHLAINCVSEAVMLLIDDIKFAPTIDPLSPGAITGFSMSTVFSDEIETTLTWVNPTTDSAGNALTDLDGVKLFRGTHPMNLAEIADLPSAIGESMSYTDILPEGDSYIYRLVPYNASGNGIMYTTPLTFFGYETVPGAPRNISFTQNANLQTVISWDEVTYGELGGSLESPVIGYTIVRKLGSVSETLVEMHPTTSYTETEIPPLNLYTYEIIAQTSTDDFGVPAIVNEYSGFNENQESVTTGKIASDQVFELGRSSIISQSIYTPEEIGGTGLITSLSYFGNLGSSTSARYKIYMSVTNRDTFGTTVNNAVWEYFGDQKLLFDGTIEFPAGQSAINIDLDQPFFYDDTNHENIIITIVKPLLENPPNINPRQFYNTSVEGMRTYYTIGYSTDLSLISTQPPAWATEDVATIPSIVAEKRTDYGSLQGTVTLSDDDSPLEDVLVTITPQGTISYQTETTLTDESGQYNLPALLPGEYLATFSKEAHNVFETSIVIEANEELILDVVLETATAVEISGTVVDEAGDGIEGATLALSGYSNFTATTDANGDFSLDAFAEKEYELEVFHPLYEAETLIFTSGNADYTLDPITLTLSLHKPTNVVAVNNNGVGEVNWDLPVGYFNETIIGWGSFDTAGEKWGNGGDPFISAIRFEPLDLQNQMPEDAELTQVKAFISNNAEIIIKVFEGENAEELIYSQPASIAEAGWYVFDLTSSLTIDVTKELWIGIEFLAGQYGAYPIGLDDGPNAPGHKGSMKYENGTWTGLNLTNKNWNIYGIVNNSMDADPIGYKVYRSPSAETDWIELTPSFIEETSYNDITLDDAEPGIYKYGVVASYGSDQVSEKAVSNEVQKDMFFDFALEITTDFGSAEGAYISISNEEHFVEAFVPASSSTVTFNGLRRGNYTVRVELENYGIVELTDVGVTESGALSIPLSLLKVSPSNLTATIEGASSARLDWTLHQAFTDQFERYEDFQRQDIGDYILKDLDGLPTHTYINFTWPNAGVPMSFMIFNPFSTTPAVSMEANSGRRFLSGMAGPNGPNNDWFIIPAGSGEFSFMAASLVDSDREKMKVLYSTTGTEVSDFTPFGGVVSVPGDWTEYTFEAPENTKYVAINFVSNDTYILKIDDLTYQKGYSHELSYNIYLDGDLVAENITDTSFILNDLSNGSHIAEVEAVYETGVSEKTEVEILVLNVDDNLKSDFVLYPNPNTGNFYIELENNATVSIIDVNGRLVHNSEKEAGTAFIKYNLASGTYIVKVKTQNGTSYKKLIVL